MSRYSFLFPDKTSSFLPDLLFWNHQLFNLYGSCSRKLAVKMSLISPDNFQHILRVMNTNLEGKRNTMFAITAIKGVGRRFANIALKKVRKLVLLFSLGHCM